MAASEQQLPRNV